MNFLELGQEILKRGAPVLGAAFGAPGLAVGALVANAFGADSKSADDILKKLNEDPEANNKLLQIQTDHIQQLEKLALQRQVLENEDRQRATNREIELARFGKNDNTPRNLVYIVTAGFLLFLFIFPYLEIDAPETQIMMILAGMLASKFSSAFDYFLGTSFNSHKKDETLALQLDRMSQSQ